MGDSRLRMPPEGPWWAKVVLKLQKVAEMFGGFGENAYLCPVGPNPPAPKIMTNKTTYYCITGISRLSGEREELTGPMEKEQAQARLERYKENTRYQKYPTYTRVRVEQLLPVQLKLPFEPNQ